MAGLLGVQLSDWQTFGLDVAGELDVDRHGRPTGRMAYPLVVWIVPRRAGKSLATLVKLLSVAFGAPRRRCWYTPHRREVGAALWRDEWFPMVEGSPLPMTVRRSNGSETMTVRRTQSTVRLFAPSGEALRSQNADLVVVDEAREFTVEQGDRLEAAVRPAKMRRPAAQLWVVSSAGDETSTWLERYRDIGRGAAEAGERGGVCYLEYAAPHGLDWTDPATWVLGHPSLADGTIGPEALEADLPNMAPARFQTEYLGWWGRGETRGVDLARWADGLAPAATMPTGRRWVSADIAPDRSRAAIAVAAATGPTVHVEVAAAGPGTAWVAGHVLALVRRGDRVRIDGYGPAGNLVGELGAKLGDRLEVAGTADVARACATLHDLLSSGRLRHRGQPELDTAAAAARARKHGDALLWDRGVTPPEVLAATLAADAAARPAEGVPAIGAAS